MTYKRSDGQWWLWLWDGLKWIGPVPAQAAA